MQSTNFSLRRLHAVRDYKVAHGDCLSPLVTFVAGALVPLPHPVWLRSPARWLRFLSRGSYSSCMICEFLCGPRVLASDVDRCGFPTVWP